MDLLMIWIVAVGIGLVIAMARWRLISPEIRRSIRTEKFQFAVGLNLRTGASAAVLLRNVLTGGPLRRQVDVGAGGLIYSLAYQF